MYMLVYYLVLKPLNILTFEKYGGGPLYEDAEMVPRLPSFFRVRLCMYVCMNVCIYLFIYLFVYSPTEFRRIADSSIFIYVYKNVRMYVCMYVMLVFMYGTYVFYHFVDTCTMYVPK